MQETTLAGWQLSQGEFLIFTVLFSKVVFPRPEQLDIPFTLDWL